MLQNEVVVYRKDLIEQGQPRWHKQYVVTGWNKLIDLAFIATERPQLADSIEAIKSGHLKGMFEIHPEHDIDTIRWEPLQVDGLVVPRLAGLTDFVHQQISPEWKFGDQRKRLIQLLGERVSFGIVNVWDDITKQYLPTPLKPLDS